MDILQLVDRMEALVNRGRHIPLTASLIVNEDDLLEVIDQLRIAIPEEIKAARRTQQERARILAEAQEEADRMTEEARKRISTMIDEHEFVAAARSRAEQVLRQAEEQAVAMREGADEYAAQTLTEFDRQLNEIQKQVRNGLASVGVRGPAEPQPQRPAPGTS
jgi:cell division septum initiation protein DivIVA